MNEEFLWVEKYRPTRIADTVLPTSIKSTLQKFVDQKNIINLIFAGPPGVGKTTAARAMLTELDANYIIINGSMNGNIDTLRNDIMNFASTVSFTGGRKYVILDEADYLNANSTQPALRNFMEEFSKNCGFILTCNYKNRIIEPLHSRCSIIDFTISKDEKPKLASAFMKRLITILDQEKVEYDKSTIATLIQKHFPDWRKILNEIQRYATSYGKVDSGILSDFKNESINSLIEMLKNKQFTNIRQWVAENSDQDATSIFRMLYEKSVAFLKPTSVPALVLIIAKYSYQGCFVVDQEINTMACLTEIMIECEFS